MIANYKSDSLFIKAQNLLEFDKILNLVSQLAISSEAKSKITKLISSELSEDPEDELKLVEQVKHFLGNSNFSLNYFENITPELELLSVKDSSLSIDAFIKFSKIILNTGISRSINFKNILTEHNLLIAFLKHFPDLTPAGNKLKSIFTEDYHIKDEASPKLQGIRTESKNLHKTIYRTFKKELEVYRNKGYLAEGEESIRNGRYVLRVLPEHKRKIPGIIIDESESGKTIFIEPQVCLELNNELIELEIDEKREIAKILFELSNDFRKYVDSFRRAYELLVEFDITLAKAHFAVDINGVKPEISFKRKINIRHAFHPLLFLRFKEKKITPIPLDFHLHDDNQIVLISGPNAGGKTVVLKTLGLLQLMLQKGLLIPVHPASVFTIFSDIWVDIGDWQSLDEGLSTYSAKIAYMKFLLQKVNENSLVLLDELGSGTEPIIGGAIAESILMELNHKKVFGIITTHYANLKAFAHKTKGIINAAMVYDEQRLEPKFKLQLGKPGSSYALDIAHKLQFPAKLINYAKQKAGKNLVDMESLISKLEQEKAELERKNTEFIGKINSLNKLIKAYENIQKQYEIKRLKLKLDTKQLELQESNQLKKESNKLVSEIREKLDIVKARQIQEENNKKSLAISQELHDMTEQYTDLLLKEIPIKEIKEGDKVFLIKHNMFGTVSELGSKKANVITEHFTFNVNISELRPVNEGLANTEKKKVNLNLIERTAAFTNVLDVRGQIPNEALKAIDLYLDKALVTNVKEVKIVHGKGKGTLRTAIHQFLKKNKFIESVTHPDESEGGTGISVLKFK